MLEYYRELVLVANKKLNLVSRRNVDEVLRNLIAESLLPLDWEICRLKSPVIDIGSGAGIPGVPLKITRLGLDVLLVESNRRKCLFLRKTINSLHLTGIDVVNDRAENVCQQAEFINFFNTLVSRATAPLADLLIWGEALLCGGGELIAWKGSGLGSELSAANTSMWFGPELHEREGGLTLVRFELKV